MTEVLLNVAPFPQPKPARNPGGDCFACGLTAVVRALFPERPIAFDTVWECFEVEAHGGGKVLSNTWSMFSRAVYALREHGYELEVARDLVAPEYNLDRWSHPWWFKIPDQQWALRLEAWLSAGWIAVAEMDFDGKGPYTPDGHINVIDHFVVLDGQRHFWKRRTDLPAASLQHETHVVCSAKGAYWINTRDLLLRHGVAGLQLIRRDRREYR